jgi:outer membrane protein assembly factor BamC
VFALSGCSSVEERRIASGSLAYTKYKTIGQPAIPEGLSSPKTSLQYAIPTIEDNNQPVGTKLPVVSPSLILATPAGTYLEDGALTSSVVIDKLDNEVSVLSYSANQVTDYLKAQNIGYTLLAEDSSVVQTDWLIEVQEADSPWYSLNTVNKELGKRFKITITPAAHGRTATVTTVLTDFVVSEGDDIVDSLDDFVKREVEAELLNAILQRYAQSQQVKALERMSQIRSGISTEEGFDKVGNPALILDTQYDIAWPKFQLVLRKLGFNVKDLDKSNGLIFVSYQGAEDSSWFSLFSEEGLPLEEDDYRIQLLPLSSDQTTITFMDEQATPFTPALLSGIFPEFAEILQQDNLDL